MIVPSPQQSQYTQLQVLWSKPSEELPKQQQREMCTLQKKLGLHNIETHRDPQPQEWRSEQHQLQLLIQTGPEKPRQRQWSDRRRLQHLSCLPRTWRQGLVRQAMACNEQQLDVKLRRAERKARQLVCRNRRNANDRKKASKVPRPGYGKAFATVDYLESELGIAADSCQLFDC